jgi:hypothetical protein
VDGVCSRAAARGVRDVAVGDDEGGGNGAALDKRLPLGCPGTWCPPSLAGNMQTKVVVVGSFNFRSWLVGLLGYVLPQRGEGEEVALVSEPPADVPLQPLLALPPGMPPEDRVQDLVLVFVDLLDFDGLLGGVLLLVLAGVAKGVAAVPLANSELLDPLGGRLLFAAREGGPVGRSLAAVTAAAAPALAIVVVWPGVGVGPTPPMVRGKRTRTTYRPILPSPAPCSLCIAAFLRQSSPV